MQKTLLFVLLFLASHVKAQIIWTDEFNTNSWNLNVVTATEGADPNFFTVSDNEGGVLPPGCGVASNGNNTLHVTSVFMPSAGASYDAGGLCGILYCPETHRRAETPVINGSGYTALQVSFNYIENGHGSLDNATLWYYNGNTWALLDDMPKTSLCSNGQGQWASRTVALPASANNNSAIKLAFAWDNNDDGVGSDPSFAADHVVVSGTASSSNLITTNALSSTSYCACNSLTIGFSSTGTFSSGNVYTAQLSDFTGSFATPVAIGSISSTANSGNITTQIPCNTLQGSAYRIRVVSSTPATLGSDNGTNITINAAVTPSIQISISSTSYCAGSPITFIANAVNGGASAVYQWKVNGINVGSNSPTYTSSTLVNSNIVTCTLTSSYPCANPSVVTSNPITITFNPAPIITVVASPSTTICAGDAVTLTATGAGVYTWTGGVTNGVPFTPMSSTTYTVTGSSSAGCTGSTVITVTVNPSLTPTLSISATPSPIVIGQNANFVANTGGATTYLIQWYKGNVLGASYSNPTNTFTTFISSSSDSVYAILYPQGCYSPDSIHSNTMIPVSAVATESVLPHGVNVYPNPTQDRLYINHAEQITSIQLYSATGALLRSYPVQENSLIELPLGDLPNSLYWLTITQNDVRYHQKVILQR